MNNKQDVAPGTQRGHSDEDITKAITTPLAEMASDLKGKEPEDPRDGYFRGGQESLLGPAVSAPKAVQEQERREKEMKADSIRPLG